MKKISIMLLAALMLFAFVACDDTTEETVPTLKVTAWTEGNITGVTPEYNVNQLSKDLKIENGKVSGTLNYVENFVAYNTADVEEQKGYYVTFKIDEEQFTDTEKVTWTSYVDGKESKKDQAFDPEFAFRLGGKDLKEEDIPTLKLEFKEGDEVYSITFDFSGVTLNNGENA